MEASHRRHAPRPHRGDEGFTLIEVIVAAGLVALAFVMMITVVGGMTGQSVALQRKDRAVSVAQSVLDRLRQNSCGTVAPFAPQGAPKAAAVNERCVVPPSGTGATLAAGSMNLEVGDVRYTNYRDTGLTRVGSDVNGTSGLSFDVHVATAFDLEQGNAPALGASACAAFIDAQQPQSMVQRVQVRWEGGEYTFTSRAAVATDALVAVSSTRGSVVAPISGTTGAYISWMEGPDTYVLRRWPVSGSTVGCAWFPYLSPGTPYEVGAIEPDGTLVEKASNVEVGGNEPWIRCVDVGMGACQ